MSTNFMKIGVSQLVACGWNLALETLQLSENK